MSMENVFWIIGLAMLIAGLIGIFVVRIAAMSEEEKLKLLKSFVIGLIVGAERIVGSGYGEEKLRMVEKEFYKKAPISYKMILSFLGKDRLQDIVEDALKEVKEAFTEGGGKS